MARATVPDRPSAAAEPPAPRRRSLPLALLVALRPQQCVSKNALVFGALAFARRLTDPQAVLQATLAFVLFCAASGMVYLINDIMDVEQDRLHPRKRFRPIAAGELPVSLAWGAVAVLLVVTLVVAVLLRPALAAIIAIYLAVQIAYSLGLKHQVILDVFIIAAGFVLRAVAGAVAIAVPISPWLYVLIGLGALFLGFAKRRAEIVLLNETAGQHRRVLEEYSATLLEEMIAIVTATTVMAYSLYTFSAENLPKNHAMMATIPFVMYGLFRYLYLVYRKDEGGSPDQLLFTDRPLLACIVLWALTAVAILYAPWP
jgi:4-hydroxybenzoate polyprenyltransferase